MNKYVTMLKTEIKLSFRGMDMVIFALCLPVVMVVLLGIIYGNQPAFEGASYSFLEQSFGAISTIAICAGGVMGLPLVISDYRQKKILKRYKVTPTSPILLLTVQVSIYAIYSLLSLILVYLVGSLFFGVRLPGSVGIFLASYLLVMLSTFSIGMMVGGVAPNMKVASIVASVLYFPMLIFSGATLPYEVMPTALQRIADILVDFQRMFLDSGKDMKPIRQKDVAQIMEVNESTISRAVKGKYLQCGWGVYALSDFMPKGTEEVSSDSVKLMLRNFIQSEDKKKPLSDQKLAQKLGEEGIQISRRTVAKYRMQMNILDAAGRRGEF